MGLISRVSSRTYRISYKPKMSFGNNDRRGGFGDRAETDKKTLFVRNLPWSATEDEILGLECFEKAVNCRITLDRETGRPRGFAHIEFEDENGAEEGFKIAESSTPELQGRDLMVDFTGSKSTGRGRGGRGGGRGGFRGRGGYDGGRGGYGGGRGGGGYDGGRGGSGYLPSAELQIVAAWR